MHDPCALLGREQGYAAHYAPHTPVEAWGFSCPAAVVTASPAASSVPAVGGNDFVDVELRVDRAAVNQAGDYRSVILAAAAPRRTGGFTNGWLGVNLAPFTGQVYSAQLAQVGLMTSDAGLQWFVYAEPGVQCVRGTPAWIGGDGVVRGCVGAVGDLVALGQWHTVELATYGQGFWVARVTDAAGVSHDVARILSGSRRIYRAMEVSEESWWTATDPGLTMAYGHRHPQYWVPGQGFTDWPGSVDGQRNDLYTAPTGVCRGPAAAGYGARVAVAGDPRSWWAGNGGAVCGVSALF